MLAPQDVSDGLQSLRISIERISHDAGRQVPNEIEQFTRTKPARDTSNTLVTPCGDQRPRGCLADPEKTTDLNDRAHLVSATVRIRCSLRSGHLGTMQKQIRR